MSQFLIKWFLTWETLLYQNSPRGGGGGGGVTCICRDTGMCHYFGYFFRVAPGFLGNFLGYSLSFGYHSLVIPGFLGIIFC